MTAAELKRKASELASRVERDVCSTQELHEAAAILRAVANAPCGHVIDLHDVICAAEKSGEDVLVIGGRE